MKFKVTEYEIVGGEERIKEEYEIEPNELKTAHEWLQERVFAGIISGYSIKPMQEATDVE